ncbi:hypothetical protein AGMMS49992_22600 [Clostridia bacterium]|nr:hypothetical protein AGMMS49992_22600 [Clostridia bacterium]
MKVDLSCPLELWEYHLPTKDSGKGGECVLMLFNLENRTISSMQISLTALNAAGQVLSTHTERPMALAAEGKQSFELRFAMAEGVDMDSLSLLFEKVWFDDGTVWRRASSAQLTEYAPNEMEPGRDLENLRYVAGPDAVGYPVDQGRVWMCVCGRANAEDEDTCRRCGRSREYIFLNDTPGAVKDSISSRENELAQKGAKAREESSRQELLKQVALRRRVKSHKRRWLGAAIASVLIVALYFGMVLLLPEITYARATSSLQNGSAVSAKAMFESLLDYRDAPEQVLACDYVIADQLLEKGDMDSVTQAQVIFEGLGDYMDSRSRVNESRYDQAALLLGFNELERAGEMFAALGSYKDSHNQYMLSEYRLAKRLMTAQQFTQASAKFTALGDYEDSADLADQCVYRSALNALTELRYDEAVAYFLSIPDYQDSAARAQEALYTSASALMTARDYAAARERYLQLGEYRDATSKWKEATYAAASQSRDEADYAAALTLFLEIKDYQDSSEQILACSYEPAKAFMASGEYEKAAQLLGAMPDYKDAADLLNQCSYLPAIAAFNSERWETAAALFDKIPNYKDSTAKASAARYYIAADLVAAGNLAEAAVKFEALGDYEDSKTRAQAARYSLAENLFNQGEYAAAKSAFEALESYSDSASRAKECAYESAVLLKDSGDLNGAYEAFSSITGLPKAKEAADSCLYSMALNARDTGDLPRAAELFKQAGTYQDAETLYNDAVFDEAVHWMDAMDFQRAGELFDLIGDYNGADSLKSVSYDLWLSDRLDTARELQSAGQLEEIVALLKDLPMDGIPEWYAELRTIYEKANLDIADSLVSGGDQLGAWAYLQDAGDSAEAKKLRDRRIFKLLGEWRTSAEVRYAFSDDGTAVLAGEDGFYFNVVNYGVLTGAEPDSLTQSFTILNYTANTLSFKDKSGKTIRLTRAPDTIPTSVDESDTTRE